MQRRSFLTLTATTVFAIGLIGCGGSNSTKTEGTGRLADVEVSPVPGATFISRDSEFTIFWSSGFEPPATFTARIYQVDGAGEITELTSNLVRDGDNFRWFLRPASSLPLRSAVYLELTSPGQNPLNFAYISGSRAQATAATPVHSRGTLAKVHQIRVR